MQVDFVTFPILSPKFTKFHQAFFPIASRRKGKENTAHTGGVFFRSVYCAFYTTKISCFCSGSTRCSIRGDRREARREPCTPCHSWRR